MNDVLTSDERIKNVTEQIELFAAQWAMKPVFDALCTLRGVSSTVAATVLAVIGDVRRFKSPRHLMAYFGLVPSEHSSGKLSGAAALPKPAITKCAACLFKRHGPIASLPVSRGERSMFTPRPMKRCARSPGKPSFASMAAIAV